MEKDRFEFGRNWQHFLKILDDRRIRSAEWSLIDRLNHITRSGRDPNDTQKLAGKTFLDIGSGSGLSSLAARRLGATVHSFDYDPQSVACTKELKRRYFPDDSKWTVEQGSVLDRKYLDSLGQFDIVYSWGVLHHTGKMWDAIENASRLVKKGGVLFISIYNDQGKASVRWRAVKRAYNRSPKILRPFIIAGAATFQIGERLTRRFRAPVDDPKALGRPWGVTAPTRPNRGMSYYYDMIDWVGGYPFEVATPDLVETFLRARQFTTDRIDRVGKKIGCNEFVFVNGPSIYDRRPGE